MKKILIIDDSQNITDLLSLVLTKKKYSVDIASTGKKGLELVNKENFDLVILDIVLPDYNGLDVLEKIKTTNPQLPVIILTAHGDYKYDFKSWVSETFITKTSNLINDILENVEKLFKIN